MKQENESTKELVKDIFNPDSLFKQATQITKAHAYDILVEQVKELKAEIESKNETIKELRAELYGSDPQENED